MVSTPPYRQGRLDDARAALLRMRSIAEAQQEMEAMEAAVVAEKESEELAPSFWDMVATKEMRLALTAGVGLQVGTLGLQTPSRC
jgi:hypothetical protein